MGSAAASGAGGPGPRLELRHITKIYGNLVANNDISLKVAPGEIHAVLGENGAGKSTLMKIIYGVTHADHGEMYWEGKAISVRNPAHARRLGIGMVFQHFSLFETLTVAENIALALEARVDLKTLSQRITEVSEHYGLPLDPGRLVHSMSIGERQRVEIVRCLLQNPRLLIMDEPTSVLTPQAVQRLFGTLRRLASEGCSILYISHKLDEIRALCQTATLLRAGTVTGYAEPAKEDAASLARLMIGRELPAISPPAPRPPGEARLVINRLNLATVDPFGTALQDISLAVRSGEIVGIAGISGNGQQELLAALSGEQSVADARMICISGQPVGRLGAAGRRDLGLAFVPEERLGRGAVPEMTLVQNALLTAYRRGMVRRGFVLPAVAQAYAGHCIEGFKVKCSGSQARAKSLSGGNLQKFIVGREINQAPQVMVVAQPTWGVDIGAAAAIHQALIDLRNSGAAILVVSEELEELFKICDRLAVIAGGRLSPTRSTAETSIEEIGLWMSGQFPAQASADQGGDYAQV